MIAWKSGPSFIDESVVCGLKETTCSSLTPVMTASELLQQSQQLNNDRKLFYEEMAEFEERKRQLAELECQLNKQVSRVWVNHSG